MFLKVQPDKIYAYKKVSVAGKVGPLYGVFCGRIIYHIFSYKFVSMNKKRTDKWVLYIEKLLILLLLVYCNSMGERDCVRECMCVSRRLRGAWGPRRRSS